MNILALRRKGTDAMIDDDARKMISESTAALRASLLSYAPKPKSLINAENDVKRLREELQVHGASADFSEEVGRTRPSSEAIAHRKTADEIGGKIAAANEALRIEQERYGEIEFERRRQVVIDLKGHIADIVGLLEEAVSPFLENRKYIARNKIKEFRVEGDMPYLSAIVGDLQRRFGLK
ncbi:MAG TPA: hypothetical protein VG271_17040 [Beijerinckiaceae bacterium]|jgi:hypothetical protein|nr:hypothetical protein [Beijerinckiaceae bacterium]